MDAPYDESVPDDAVASYLQGVTYPIEKTELAEALAQNGAPGGFVDKLMATSTSSFASLDDILAHLQDIGDGNTAEA